MIRISTTSLAALFAATSVATAQNDECMTALPLAVGTTAFDTSAATLSPEPWPCAGTGGPDLWYTFTAATSATHTISTCGSTYDTALEVFTGACGTLTSLACNDDACTLQSSISFTATPGTAYTLRVGGYNNLTGAGTLTLDDGSPVLDPVGGNYYIRVLDVGITWDQALADAAAMSHMGVSGRLATLNSQQENDFVYALGDVHNFWIGGFQNTMSPTYSEPDGGWEWITGEPFAYTNWLAGEPNNTGSFGAEDYLELLQSAGLGETWNDAAQMEHPRGYVVEFPVGSVGTNYCTANMNSTGSTGSMAATGSTVAANNDLTLIASDLPNFSFGFFITSMTQGFVANPAGSQGNLCVGGSIGRYVGAGQIMNSGNNGEIELQVDLTMTPQPNGLVSVASGETWNFQLWHRDSVGGMAASNFTDGLEVTFF